MEGHGQDHFRSLDYLWGKCDIEQTAHDVTSNVGAPTSGKLFLVVNKVPSAFNAADVRARVEQTYNCPVAAVLPHSDEMMALASSGIFSIRYPDHPVSQAYRRLAEQLVA